MADWDGPVCAICGTKISEVPGVTRELLCFEHASLEEQDRRRAWVAHLRFMRPPGSPVPE